MLEHILLTIMEEFRTSIQAGTHPAHNDGRFPHFHPSWNTSYSQWWKISTLPSRLEHILLTMMEDLCTYIHPGWNHILLQWWKSSTLTSIQDGTHPTHNDERDLHLHPSKMEHILHAMMEGLALIYDLVGTNPTVISEWPLVLDWAT